MNAKVVDMHQCRHCPFEAKSKAGLSSHLRFRHAEETAAPGTVYESVAAQVPKGAPVGLRASALKLAWAMDTTESTRELAALGRELRATLAEIAGDQSEESGSDGVDDLAARRAARRAAASS